MIKIEEWIRILFVIFGQDLQDQLDFFDFHFQEENEKNTIRLRRRNSHIG